MRKRLTALGGSLALVTAAIVIPALPTAAAANYNLSIELDPVIAFDDGVIDWEVSSADDAICSDPVVEMNNGSDAGGVVSINADGMGGTLDLREIDGFDAGFTIECGDDSYNTGDLPFNTLDIVKFVGGIIFNPAAPGETPEFKIEVKFELENGDSVFSETITVTDFSKANLLRSYFITQEGTWYTAETEDGGAIDSGVEDPEVDVNLDGEPRWVEVYNLFPEKADFNTIITPHEYPLSTDPVMDWEFDYPADIPPICDDPIVISMGEFFSDGVPTVVDPGFDVEVGSDGLSGTIDISNSPASGFIDVVLACGEGYEYTFYGIHTVLQQFTVDKKVEGDAPSDAEFIVEVTSSFVDPSEEPAPGSQPFSMDIAFDAAGGEQTVYRTVPGAADGIPLLYWEVDETEDGGAESTAIEQLNFGGTPFEGFEDPFATITNTFPEAEKPEDEEKEEEPAKPANGKPAFTG